MYAVLQERKRREDPAFRDAYNDIFDITEIGHEVVRQRAAKGWSQLDLAVASGVHLKLIDNVEEGISVGVDKLILIAKALDMHLKLV